MVITTRPVNMLLLLVIMLAMDSTNTQFSGKYLSQCVALYITKLVDLNQLYGSPDTRPWGRQVRGGRNSYFRWEYTETVDFIVFFKGQVRGALAWNLGMWRS